MKRRDLLPLLLTLPALAHAAPPAVQLLIELRWVDSALAPSAQAGVRDGAVVVGTAGAVSPRGPGVVTSTVPAVSVPTQRLLVQNGERASARLTTREPLQWVDTTVELGADAARRRIYASPRQQERHGAQSFFMVTPSWPGGDAPVRLTFDVEDGGNAYQSTLSLPMGRWQTAARIGGALTAPARGSVNSRDAAGQPERELQLRVSIQY